MSNKPYFQLEWFSATNDKLVGEERLDVTEKQIRKWFYIMANDSNVDGLIVRASQRKQLQALVKHQIDLNKHDYFVSHVMDYGTGGT